MKTATRKRLLKMSESKRVAPLKDHSPNISVQSEINRLASKKAKQYTIIKSHSKRGDKEITDTLEGLINYFSYTLEIGNSWNKTINRMPKTIKSFISNINKPLMKKKVLVMKELLWD